MRADRGGQGLSGVPRITGRFDVPVLTMHDLGDLFVPFSMEQEYARNAVRRGTSDLLVQRAVRGVQHCDFSAQEYQQAFSDLVMWAHGFRGSGPELTVDSPPDGLRQYLVEHGYAWAASSYTENGYDVV